MIYFIQAPSKLIKIGHTDSMGDRLSGLRRIVSPGLRLLAVHDGGFREEASLHETFGHLRELGEWFWPGRDLAHHIADKGRHWTTPPRRKPKRLVPDPAREKPIVRAWPEEDGDDAEQGRAWRFHIEWEGRRYDFTGEGHRAATRLAARLRGSWFARRMLAGQPCHRWRDVAISTLSPPPETPRPMTSHELARKLLARPDRKLGLDPRTVFPEFFEEDDTR